MNSSPDPLEDELATFRPADPSPEFRRDVADRLKADEASLRRRRAVVAIGGIAAAALAAALVARISAPRPAPDPGPPPFVAVGPTSPDATLKDDSPSVLVYGRALADSPEVLQALLDRHASRGAAFGSPPLRAFNPRPEFREIPGGL